MNFESAPFAVNIANAYFKMKIQWWTWKRIHYLCEDEIEKHVLGIIVCHCTASLVMPNGDSQDGFFYNSTLTHMTDSSIAWRDKCLLIKMTPVFKYNKKTNHSFFALEEGWVSMKRQKHHSFTEPFYNQATSNLAIYSHETSQDKLPEA